MHWVERMRTGHRSDDQRDLTQRGLLDDTLVIWGGEFGRTPFCQGDINDMKTLGRDHRPYVFTIWIAGGGVKRGFSYGKSDDFADNPAKDPVHVHDKFQSRYFRLTDVHGRVVNEILG